MIVASVFSFSTYDISSLTNTRKAENVVIQLSFLNREVIIAGMYYLHKTLFCGIQKEKFAEGVKLLKELSTSNGRTKLLLTIDISFQGTNWRCLSSEKSTSKLTVLTECELTGLVK